ncbi:MAG: phosphoglucosamine mutase [Candidatus Omnitrophica bacterium]|nr:phosphoglucosamine mutase [Candidatus Omnitrophota bacterium]
MNNTPQYPRITISGARGIVGKDLTADNAQRMAWAYARFIGGGTVVLARDARPSGRLLRSAVESGLLAGGCDVLDIGLAPTPTAGIMIRTVKAKGGINITASHNPSPWNALKMFGTDGTFPSDQFVQEYIQFLHHGGWKHAEWDEIGATRLETAALETHCRLIEEAIDCDKIREKNYRVAVDGCRSVGGLYLPAFLERLGCEVIRLDCEADGNFQRELEPTPENLGRLCEKVKQEKADAGFAADPDADRLAIVSEQGEAIGEEYTLAFATYAALQKAGGGLAATNLSTSMLTDFAAKQAGGRVIRTAIGEANVAQAIRERHAVIGGEGNGGVMYPAVHNGRDSLTAAALTLQFMADSGQNISELKNLFPNYVILKDKVHVDLEAAKKRLDELAASPLDGEIDAQDGVKIIRDEAWLHLRCSNTEPIVRLIAEARGEAEARKLMEEGKRLLAPG